MLRRALMIALLPSLGCSSGDGGSNAPVGDAASTDDAVVDALPGGDALPESDAPTIDAPAADSRAIDSGTDTHTDPPPPPPIVGACDGLGAVGAFEDVTPPDVKKGMATGGKGTFAFAVDPVHQGTVYLGTNMAKVWKSTDCGATWTHPNTGKNGAELDRGMNWTFKVDPINPDIVYTNSGYGANGLYKSINAGVDWNVVWPPAKQPELGKAFTYNFANVIAMDPKDHQHVLLTFHEGCLPPHTQMCIAETLDGGDTWKLMDGDPSWAGSEGQIIFFLDDSRSWLWGSQTNGFWTTTNGGGKWTAISGASPSHLQSSGMVQSPSGAYVVAASEGVFRRAAAAGSPWKLIDKTGPIAGGLVNDGASLYVSTCYFPDFCKTAAPYLVSRDDGLTWTVMPSPKMPMGGSMDYDAGHGLMYSSNGDAFWRVRVK